MVGNSQAWEWNITGFHWADLQQVNKAKDGLGNPEEEEQLRWNPASCSILHLQDAEPPLPTDS